MPFYLHTNISTSIFLTANIINLKIMRYFNGNKRIHNSITNICTAYNIINESDSLILY